MPSSGPSAAAFTAALTCSTVTGSGVVKTRSTTEPVATGARIANPFSLPFSSGSTRPTASAAPVRGVVVDRRHQPLVDAEAVVQHLGQRRQAVGRAGGVGDDVVLLGVVVALAVDAPRHGHVRLLCRGGDDYLLRPRRQVLCGIVAGGEEAS